VRRLLLLLAGLLLAAPVQAAKVLIVERQQTSTTSMTGFSADLNRARSAAMFNGLLDRTGVDYTWGPSNTIKTEWGRTGVVPTVLGGDRVETFGGVIDWNASFGTTSGWRNTAYRLDSLLNCTKALLVPHLLVNTNWWAMAESEGATGLTRSFISGSVCTTGVAAATDITNPTYGPFLHDGSGTGAWTVGTYASGWPMSSYEPRGGRRIMLQGNTGSYWLHAPVCTPWNANFDSVVTGSVDTALVWMLPRDEVSGSSAAAIFANVAGAGGIFDSAGGDKYLYCENDPLLMLYSLAVLDSQMAGGLFDSDHLPIKVGVTIDGGFRHQSRASFTGGYAPDSATIKANAARLAGIPAVLGVNVDSVNAYPYEKGWWALWTALRYTPQSWARVEDSTAVAGRDTAGVLHLEDIFGRLRKRTAYGPAYTSGADTSSFALLKYAKDRTAVLFPGKVSSTLLAPLDDILPANWGGKADSVLYAIAEAGFTTARVHGKTNRNLQDRALNPLNLYGWQHRKSALGSRINLLAHNGYSQRGATAQGVWQRTLLADDATDLNPWRDTTCAVGWTSPGGGAWDIFIEQTQRVAAGLIGRDLDGDKTERSELSNTHGYTTGYNLPMDDYQHPYTHRASIIRLCVNDFAGDPNGPPAQNGYLLLKNLDNAFRAINAAAGRTVITFAYPEDIRP